MELRAQRAESDAERAREQSSADLQALRRQHAVLVRELETRCAEAHQETAFYREEVVIAQKRVCHVLRATVAFISLNILVVD